MSDVTPAGKHGRPSLVDLQADVVAAREELVASIAELRHETSAPALAARAGRSVVGLFTDEYGGIRPERVAIAAVVVVGVLALTLRRRRR